LKFFLKLIGSGLGTGYSPLASGTVGSFAALLIWILLPSLSALQQASLIVVTFFIGVPICTQMEAEYGHDPSQATFDEFVGQWVSLFLLPKTPAYLAASFILFRALDVWKPFPARDSQKLPGGWGIMVDDLIVGVYVCILLTMMRLFLAR
jgi:phosphatidylglycerophosphatase A